MNKPTEKIHIPVMLEESLAYLDLKPNGTYVDGTLGEAGHSLEILKVLHEGNGKLYSFDQDQKAISLVSERYKATIDDQWELVHANFANINTQIPRDTELDGILLDIGISSRHIEDDDRGFSYQELNQPLDMRMDTRLGVTAKDLLKVLNQKQLTRLFQEFGEERHAGRIASAIKRHPYPIEQVGDLVAIIDRVMPAASRQNNKHPEKRVFQALRIAVNSELESLKEGLVNGFEKLKTGGRFVVISFHSLEDRIVKKTFKSFGAQAVPVEDGYFEPKEDEIEANPRARSAKMRVIEKT